MSTINKYKTKQPDLNTIRTFNVDIFMVFLRLHLCVDNMKVSHLLRSLFLSQYFNDKVGGGDTQDFWVQKLTHLSISGPDKFSRYKKNPIKIFK